MKKKCRADDLNERGDIKMSKKQMVDQGVRKYGQERPTIKRATIRIDVTMDDGNTAIIIITMDAHR